MISRSLGPEFGGSIGIIFSLANAVGVALYVVGFGETVQQLMESHGASMIDKHNDVRVIGIVVLCLLLGVTLIGLDWVIRTQLGLLLILVISMINYFIGCFSGSVLTPRSDQEQQGFTALSSATFKENFMPEFRETIEGGTFFAAFSIFFPAATGILAGVNISGDLKNPGYAIPKGTFTAVGLTTVVYIGLAWMIGACTLRDAFCDVKKAMSNITSNGTTLAPLQTITQECEYGLLHDLQVGSSNKILKLFLKQSQV